MSCRHIFHCDSRSGRLIGLLMRSGCLREESKGVESRVAVQNAEHVDVHDVDVNPRLDLVFLSRSHDLTPRPQTLQ
jgi:hypothetical protein